MAEIVFDYQFKFADGKQTDFRVRLDAETGHLIDDEAGEAADWTKLEFHKCSHCPYNAGEMPVCPVARSLSRVAETFKQDLSHKATKVFVKTENRIYGKDTDLQVGLQSLFGLVMGASKCSHMRIFKVMSRFHLPFSSFDETIVRIMGKHFIGQFLKSQKEFEQTGKSTPKVMNLDELVHGYSNVNTVNQHLIRRIRAISKGDADKNAVVILDSFASLLPLEMQTGFENLSKIFNNAA